MVIMQQLQKQDRRPFHGMVKAYGNIQQWRLVDAHKGG
jgi:hypothetical protein